MDGITLYYMARELNEKLCGARIDRIQQPERDEIILSLRCPGENVSLLISSAAGCERIHLTEIKKTSPLEPAVLCMLMRKHLLGGRISLIEQLDGDRMISINVEHTDELGDRAKKTILCELMGKHSNIVLLSADGRILECARHINESVSSYREVLPGIPYTPPPAHGKLTLDSFTSAELSERLEGKSGDLAKIIQANISALSMPLAREAAFRATGNAELCTDNAALYSEKIKKAIESMLSAPSPNILIGLDGEYVKLSAFEYALDKGLQRKTYATLSQAADDYYRLKDLAERLQQKSSALSRAIRNNIERLEKKLLLQQDAYDDAANSEDYRIRGEMLMASPHLVRKGMKQVSLPNYYDENCALFNVVLDEKLDAQANAQRYFKLYKKAQVARKLAKEQLESGQTELEYLEGLNEDLEKCSDESALAELRAELVKAGYIRDTASRRQIKALPASRPMEFRAPDGTLILAGRNNTQNEELTFAAQPDEVWLHAKNVPGSHVIIKSASPSDETLSYAASVAAALSRAKHDLNVEVDTVRRKYLRKPAGSKPGYVTFTHQKTLSVHPIDLNAMAHKQAL